MAIILSKLFRVRDTFSGVNLVYSVEKSLVLRISHRCRFSLTLALRGLAWGQLCWRHLLLNRNASSHRAHKWHCKDVALSGRFCPFFCYSRNLTVSLNLVLEEYVRIRAHRRRAAFFLCGKTVKRVLWCGVDTGVFWSWSWVCFRVIHMRSYK